MLPLGTAPTNGDIILSSRAIHLADALRHDHQVQTDPITRTRVALNWMRETEFCRTWSAAVLHDINRIHAIFAAIGEELPVQTGLRTAEGYLTLTEKGWMMADDADKLAVQASQNPLQKRPSSILRLPNGMLFRLDRRVTWDAGEPSAELTPLPLAEQLLSFRAFTAEATAPR